MSEPTPRLWRLAYVAASSASCPPSRERKRPFVTCDAVTRPIVRYLGSTPPMVYDVLWMFVCGGSTTCLSVCSGVVTRVRNWRKRCGRHLRAAAESKKPPRRPPPPPKPCCWGGAVCCCPTPAFWKQAWIFANSAALGGVIRRKTLICWPPALIFATIFGTTPSWCTPESTRPVDTAETPFSEVIALAWLDGNVSCVPGRKKSWTKCVPGLPSFERSVTADWFASSSWRPPPPPPPGPKPPTSCCCG